MFPANNMCAQLSGIFQLKLRTFSYAMDVLLRLGWKRVMIYHTYFRRSGFYRFALKNILYLLLIMGALIGAFSYVEHHIIDLGPVFENLFTRLETNWVYGIFFISESLLGLLPPDFFLIWAKNFPRPYQVVTILAVLSFLGGIVSYYLGRALSFNKAVSQFIGNRYKKNFAMVKKWGGVFIVLAALFPLPFSIVCLLAGLLRFPPPLFFIFSSTRILRFYAYAWAIFNIL